MLIRSAVVRISGNVALANGEIKSFNKTYDSTNFYTLEDSNLAHRVLFPSQVSTYDTLDPWNGSIIGATLSRSKDPDDSSEVVTSFSMVVTGLVSYTDDSTKSFSFEIRDNGAAYNFNSEEGNQAWLDLADNSMTNLGIRLMFSGLLSTSTDVITITFN